MTAKRSFGCPVAVTLQGVKLVISTSLVLTQLHQPALQHGDAVALEEGFGVTGFASLLACVPDSSHELQPQTQCQS